MKSLLGKMRSPLMLLVFVTAQTHLSALAQPAPGGQHPALLASYALRPPWKVAGVDYAVGIPAMTTLTDWQLLSGPGITVKKTATPGQILVRNTSNVVISGVNFSLHGGATLTFVNSPNLTVTNSNFGGTNLTTISSYIIYADANSPGLTVSYNTIDGGGAGSGSALVGAAGSGTTTLTYNWLKNFPQHVLQQNTQSGTDSIVYKYNLIEQGAKQPGAHLNYLEFDTNSSSSTSVDVEYNTSYQIKEASAGEGYQFYANGNGLVQNVTLAYNVMIAAAPGVGLPVPVSSLSISRMVHGGGSQNAGIAHDNYIDSTAAYGWLYPGSFSGWNFSNNYNMVTRALIGPPPSPPPPPQPPVDTTLPTISGTPQVGQTLSTDNGTWTNNPTSFTYQWMWGDSSVHGTASTYLLTSIDVTHTLRVSVIATNASGASVPAISLKTPLITAPVSGVPVNTAVPTIGGVAQVSKTLTTDNGTWTNNPTSFTYQWMWGDGSVHGTASTYVLTSIDTGHTLRVSVIAINASGSSAPAISLKTAFIAP